MASKTSAAGWTSQPSLLPRIVKDDLSAQAPKSVSSSAIPAASAASPVFSAAPPLSVAPLTAHAAQVAPESLESQINKAALAAQKFANAIQNDATTSKKAEPLFEQFAALQQAYILEERRYSDRDAQVKAHASTIAKLESELTAARKELEAAKTSAASALKAAADAKKPAAAPAQASSPNAASDAALAQAKDTVLELTRQLAVSKEAQKTAEAAQQSQKATILQLQGELERAQKALEAARAPQPAVAAAAAAASPESKPGLVKPVGAEVKQAPAEVVNIPNQLAALDKLKKAIEADVAKHTKGPDATGVACKTDADARINEYNAIAAECVKIQAACEPFYKALNETIAAQTMHPMSERAIIAAAKHTGMTPDDYKKNVIAVWDSALKDNTALREKTKAEWNKLDLELKTLSRHVAWLETGITNKGVPSSWQLSGGWVREAKGSDNAKYPFDGRNVQLV